jgi:hypothetical protein
MTVDTLTRYYSQQGNGEPETYYRASILRQSGRGSFWRNLWRIAKPLTASLGKRALTTGANILADIASAPPDISAKDIAKKRLREAKQSLLSDATSAISTAMTGKGRRKRKAPRTQHGGRRGGGAKKPRSTCSQRGRGIKRSQRTRVSQSRRKTPSRYTDIFQ